MRVFGFVGQSKSDKPTRFLMRVLNRRFRVGDYGLLAPGVDPGGVERLSCALLASDLLSLLIDRWINSGMSQWTANGKTGQSDSPFERTPWKEVLEDFFKRNPPRFAIDAEGPFLLVIPDFFGQRKAPPSWMAEQAESVLLAELGPSDSLEVRQTREMVHRLAPVAADVAVSLYLQWMDTPERAKLSRCYGCRRYFLRSRQPNRKTPIKNGSWCPRCQGKGASLRVAGSRSKRRARVLATAADVWPLWRQDQSGITRAEWVAHQVNERLKSSEDRIARNWITRHQDKIEAEVDRRKHAKG